MSIDYDASLGRFSPPASPLALPSVHGYADNGGLKIKSEKRGRPINALREASTSFCETSQARLAAAVGGVDFFMKDKT